MLIDPSVRRYFRDAEGLLFSCSLIVFDMDMT